MTLIQLIEHLRVSILDDTGGTAVDWTTVSETDIEAYQLRWSNEELTRFINEAQNKVCSGSLVLRKSEEDFYINVVAGTAEYDYNPLIIKIKSAVLGSEAKELYPTEFEQLIGIKDWRTKEHTPTHYVVDESAYKIRLYPIPVINDELQLIYNRLPLTPLDWATPDGVPEIPEQYQIDMLDYAAHMAYMKDEANTLDPQKAITHLQKFNAQFSNNSAYTETRRRRTSNRGTRYRDFF